MSSSEVVNTGPAVEIESEPQEMVVIDYEDLKLGNHALREKIRQAYGYDGLGILAVVNVPEYWDKREALLPLAHKLATLPDDKKAALEDEPSTYSVGWSHGKEKFNGKPDYSKGSFYANPLHDTIDATEEEIAKYPAFLAPNIWPSEDIPAMEHAFKDLGQLIVNVGRMLSRHVDEFVRSVNPAYATNTLSQVLTESRCCKGRLLYYFPPSESQLPAKGAPVSMSDFDSWCGWHNDHGSLTGLCAAMYVTEDGKEIPNPDPAAGLYIRSRHHKVVHLKPPPRAMCFQIGETAQVHSGGALQATPHAVRAAAAPGVARATLAVFMEPEWHTSMDAPAAEDADRVTRGARGELLPPGVPPLQGRWEPGIDFGEFSERTFASYY